MTANRFWVRYIARWLARIEGVSSMLRLAMLGLTGISTATLTLQQYGYGYYAWHFIGITTFLVIMFTYLYTEGGVWNQVNRDKRDLSNNFAGPNARIVTEMTARALMASIQDKDLTEKQRDIIKHELDRTFKEYRKGLDMDKYE